MAKEKASIDDLYEPDFPEQDVVVQEDNDVDVVDNTAETIPDEPNDIQDDTVDDNVYDIEDSYKLRVGDEVFEAKDLISNYKKMSGLEKKMTQDLQKLAKDKGEFKNTVAWGKSLESLRESLLKDSTLLEKVKSVVEESGDKKAIEGLNHLLNTDLSSVVDPYAEEKDELRRTIENDKLEREYGEKKNSLMSEYEIDEETFAMVEDACIEIKEKENKYIDLEHMILKMIKDGRIVKEDPKDKKDIDVKTVKKLPSSPRKLQKNSTGESETRKKQRSYDPLRDGVSEEMAAKYASDIFSPE